MFHKINNLSIVALLANEPLHTRAIAKRLDTSPATAMRMLRLLQKNAIVDCKTEGKNKVYSLKQTPEAAIARVMAQQDKLQQLMRNPEMRLLYTELKAKTDGELIVLFGSHAKGIATKRSDIDIYVETEDEGLRKRIQRISDKLSVKIGAFRKDSDFGAEIVKNHVVIQNAERFCRLTQ
jgi:predicted nucleotidyltransferase